MNQKMRISKNILSKRKDTMKICETCRFLDHKYLTCRINAPTGLVSQDPRSLFPMVTLDCWCGQWEEEKPIPITGIGICFDGDEVIAVDLNDKPGIYPINDAIKKHEDEFHFFPPKSETIIEGSSKCSPNHNKTN